MTVVAGTCDALKSLLIVVKVLFFETFKPLPNSILASKLKCPFLKTGHHMALLTVIFVIFLHAEILMVSLTFQTQIQYLKQVQQPSAAQLRSSMVDPAINLFFLKMKAELEQTKDKLEQAQNELSAWKFTPDR